MPMANRMQLLDARLQRVDARTQTIIEAGVAQRAAVQPAEEWWPSLVLLFGSEDAMFQQLGVDRMLFDEALALVRDVVAHRRSGRSFDKNGLFFIIESFSTVLMGPRVLRKSLFYSFNLNLNN